MSPRRKGLLRLGEAVLGRARTGRAAPSGRSTPHTPPAAGPEPAPAPTEPAPAPAPVAARARPAPAGDPGPEAEGTAELLDRIISGRLALSLFQPVVDLATRETVGYEALARGPVGSALERPDLLFAAAHAAGRVADLDWTCRAAAFEAALECDFGGALTLFVNAEPMALDTLCPDHLAEICRSADRRLTVAIEITERALTGRPAELVRSIAQLRERGYGIALDDVGADTRSLALMPLLRPDVIKLDLRLVHAQPTAEIAAIVNAVAAQRERTAAAILAEGIESEEHLLTAQAMGATLGQGWLFGRPDALPSPLPVPEMEVFLPDVSPRYAGTTPYEVVSAVRTTRVAAKPLLTAMSAQLEAQTGSLGEAGVLLSAFQTAARFTPHTAGRYAALAAKAAFVAAIGAGLGPEPAPGVRGADLGEGDGLRGEWSVVVLGPHFAGALVAKDLGDSGPESSRRFDFALTYDRDLVVEAASALLARVVPVAASRRAQPLAA